MRNYLTGTCIACKFPNMKLKAQGLCNACYNFKVKNKMDVAGIIQYRKKFLKEKRYRNLSENCRVCGSESKVKGLCVTHYGRAKKQGVDFDDIEAIRKLKPMYRRSAVSSDTRCLACKRKKKSFKSHSAKSFVKGLCKVCCNDRRIKNMSVKEYVEYREKYPLYSSKGRPGKKRTIGECKACHRTLPLMNGIICLQCDKLRYKPKHYRKTVEDIITYRQEHPYRAIKIINVKPIIKIPEKKCKVCGSGKTLARKLCRKCYWKVFSTVRSYKITWGKAAEVLRSHPEDFRNKELRTYLIEKGYIEKDAQRSVWYKKPEPKLTSIIDSVKIGGGVKCSACGVNNSYWNGLCPDCARIREVQSFTNEEIKEYRKRFGMNEPMKCELLKFRREIGKVKMCIVHKDVEADADGLCKACNGLKRRYHLTVGELVSYRKLNKASSRHVNPWMYFPGTGKINKIEEKEKNKLEVSKDA